LLKKNANLFIGILFLINAVFILIIVIANTIFVFFLGLVIQGFASGLIEKFLHTLNSNNSYTKTRHDLLTWKYGGLCGLLCSALLCVLFNYINTFYFAFSTSIIFGVFFICFQRSIVL
jgi:hypothetical protein